MTTEESHTDNSPTPAPSEAAAGTEAILPAAPTLNREQRRAQSKGKKGTTPGAHSQSANAPRFSSGRPANAPIQNKIPRTGHK